jgi:hypothetical protein
MWWLGHSLEGLPLHDHGRDCLFINNPCSDTTGGGHHPELPAKGVQAGSTISVFGGRLAHWYCTRIVSQKSKESSL